MRWWSFDDWSVKENTTAELWTMADAHASSADA